MAIFGIGKTKEAKPAKAKAPKAVKAVKATKSSATVEARKDVVIRPHITEKAGIAAESKGVYTFRVSADATKTTVAKAIEAIYNVSPVKVNIINRSSRDVVVRGRQGKVSGFKKAMVFLKKGDKIEFV